uniref:DUF4440 domain-containing protein n=1 Tax=Panagrolaimus sp. ES5 TaxID=591445 RepID=A0AC34GWR8_9BILA
MNGNNSMQSDSFGSDLFQRMACKSPMFENMNFALFQEIKSRQEDFMRAFNEGNAAKAAEIYSPDGVFMPNSSQPLRGRKDIEQYFKSDMADGVATAQIITEEVKGCDCEKFAYERGSYHLNGKKGLESGTYLQVWKKENGVWLVQSDCFNVTKPASG